MLTPRRLGVGGASPMTLKASAILAPSAGPIVARRPG
jgi:hypothetical protein